MKKKVAFICIHNSCRSQMAEGWAKHLGANVMDAFSAGTEYYPEVKPMVLQVMDDAGVSMEGFKPKLLSEIPGEVDILITMGCTVVCPTIPHHYHEDWNLLDPTDGPIEGFIDTRELIKHKVIDLIARIKKGDL